MLRWLRNPEFRKTFTIYMITGMICAGFCAFFSWECALIVLLFVCIIEFGLFAFSEKRYRQLAKLSDYLKKVNSGIYHLDIQDYDEGELSILKSEIYKTTLMLRLQAEALEDEKFSLSNAMSDISHQLKTPLTSMLVMIDLLRDPNLPEQVRHEFTDRMRNQLERIQWLLTSLLKLAKLDAGTVRFSPEKVHLNVLLKKVIEPLAIPIEIKSQSLKVYQKNIHINCDLNWTVEAILNILKNCVEHTPEGGYLEIRCNYSPLFTEILIYDTGIGISPEDLPHIFERFYRGKNADSDSVGIGLAMAKSIITLQGGYVDVKSIQGQGSCFSVKFFN